MTGPQIVDNENDDDSGQVGGVDARRLAQWVIVAGLVLGIAAAGFLIWEAWSANQDALEHNRHAGEDAQVFPFSDGAGGPPPSAAGPPAGPGGQEGLETS